MEGYIREGAHIILLVGFAITTSHAAEIIVQNEELSTKRFRKCIGWAIIGIACCLATIGLVEIFR